MKRKDFLWKTGAACVGVAVIPMLSCSKKNKESQIQNTPFVLPELGFAYSALEPAIDARTMELHHSKHHAGYVKKLNAALENHRLKGSSLEKICTEITYKASDIKVLNNGGGHYNHSLYWEILQPGGASNPKGKLAKQIVEDFGSFTNFSECFTKSAATIFGSGWAWLAINEKGKLFVTTTQNQENPLMKNIVDEYGIPILGIDVWEHAYYLNYQNKRGDYIQSFMNLINWDVVAMKYASVK